MVRFYITLITLFLSTSVFSQSFYFGADMSYVNEMEDCGVVYQENQQSKDPYTIFSDYGCNLVRLRLWHTPEWYDNLNEGRRYSDLGDVKRSIQRAKQDGMQVLLDFHLSDNWADPSKQLVPKAWLSVVDDVDALKDSLYNYIYETLIELDSENLLPELIQIGNETNKGILLSPEDNEVWTLDWERNAILFNSGIQAVKDAEDEIGNDIKIVIHVAGPDNAEWLIDGFYEYGITDFDIIGLSYYWAWHQPTTIEETGEIIEMLKSLYPEKEVLVVETGYIWTTEWNDSASNIISATHPDFHPASPTNQKMWMTELSQEVFDAGGIGVIYWEPCWVSSTCFTQWGQGSHQEHATFFDFDNNLIVPGAIEWMQYEYDFATSTQEIGKERSDEIQILTNSFSGDVKIRQLGEIVRNLRYTVTDSAGTIVLIGTLDLAEVNFTMDNVPPGMYIITIQDVQEIIKTKTIVISR